MMMQEGLVQWVRFCNFSELLNLSGDRLEQLLGKDFAAMKGYSQNNPHHCYDLLEHTIRTVEVLDCSGLNEVEAVELTIAALFHDIGKPFVALQKNGRTVFYNHAVKSGEVAEKELEKQDLGECSLGRIRFYIEHHDDFISFKLKSEIKNNKNPFIVPITSENVSRKILDTQENCRKHGRYTPTVNDYALLMRLCIADAKAQNLQVMQKGVLTDSLAQKLARLNAILAHITKLTAEG